MQELRDSTDLERNETVREIDDTQNELEDAQNHISQLESQLSELVNQQRSATDTDGSHKELQELQMRNELDVLTRERDELADLWDNHDCSTSMISRTHSISSDGRPHTTSNTSQPPASRGSDGSYKPALPRLLGLEEQRSLQVDLQEAADYALVAAQVGLGGAFTSIQGKLVAQPQVCCHGRLYMGFIK
jgi:hypothetical protein